jgi:hypothetical protein
MMLRAGEQPHRVRVRGCWHEVCELRQQFDGRVLIVLQDLRTVVASRVEEVEL